MYVVEPVQIKKNNDWYLWRQFESCKLFLARASCLIKLNLVTFNNN